MITMSATSAAQAPVTLQAPPTTVVALVAHARGVPSAAREAFAAECAALADDEAVILVHTVIASSCTSRWVLSASGSSHSCRLEDCDWRTPPRHAT